MSKNKTIEQTYKKLDQRTHVLERSGMYIGSVKKNIEELWVMPTGASKMVKKMVDYSPGFLKIFDEVLTNAIDHSARDPTLNTIKVEYDKKTGEISVWNNGSGVPIVLHKEHNMYVPELIFGHLLSGSNYDDSEQRTGAGTNGLGSKVSNIFSKKFVIETIDSEEKKKFYQEYANNMTERSKPKITSNTGKSYTKITFIPDYQRFSMKGLEEDTISLINKRVYDCIACTNSGVQVYLNGEKLKGKGLVDYTKYLFDGEKVISESHIETSRNKNGQITEYVWEYAVVPYSQYEQISFVNGNATSQGGKHVDYVLYQIINKLKKLLEDKKKLKDVKPNFIKDKMFVFLKATVANPSFNSQTKEQLTTPSKDFGCNVIVSDAFVQKIYKSSITEEIVEFCKLKETAALAKQTDGRKTSRVFIPKLDEALWAGTAKSKECTLILTEGDSAKTFAMWGRSIDENGPKKYGVFPLKGKLLNIRDATISQLIGNEEINNLKQIIGLKQDKVYKDTDELRYGKVMVLTDSDVDGSHIKALLVNFFHANWPSLVKMDYIQTIRTPIVKAIKGNKVIEFFTEQDYHKWKDATGTSASNYHIRYFKGLGTSKKEDAKDTFKRIGELKIDYYYKDKKCDEAILLAFDKDKNVKPVVQKGGDLEVESNLGSNNQNLSLEDENIKCTDKRKKWLSKYDKNVYIGVDERKVSYQDLINKELIHFSIYDNLRSIPSLCDGLKPSQRKILYYMLKNNITKVIKVAQLSGYVSAETGYHHGEASLQGAIVGMAQNFVGTNNINLLYPDGNHGCLDPNTEILMWNGKIKQAKDVDIGDKLIGDDGKIRTVLQTTKGNDIMYKVSTKNKYYIVNSKHILTLKFTNNKKVYWKESSKSWNVNYFNIKTMKECYKQFRTVDSTNIKQTYNKCMQTKEEAFKDIIEFVNNIDENSSPNDGIFDIKIEDFLKLSKCTQNKFYSISNSSCIDWKNEDLPIDPYILGSWIGDGKSNGSGITSIDEEVLKEWVIYLDNINCELVHSPGNKNINRDNYSYAIRKKGFGYRMSIGDINNSNEKCIACNSYKNSKICNWHYENKDNKFLADNIKKISEVINYDRNEFTFLLKNGQKVNVNKNFELKLRFQGHKKICWDNINQTWFVEYFDGFKNKYKTMTAKNKNKNDVLKEIQLYIENLNIQESDVFYITIHNYLQLPKTTQNKLTAEITSNKKNNWVELLEENNLLNNKYIPEQYIINSKENRLKLLAGIIDTDGTVKYMNGIPRIEISQSKRLRYHIIKSIEFLCHSLGYQTTLRETKNNNLTKKGDDMTQIVISIYGDNLYQIPTKIPRKKIIKYVKKLDSYKHSFNIECIGKGPFCGWQLDGNERFILNNFIVTHNSRLMNGKDSASPRYIYTRLSDITQTIFNPYDSPLLHYLDDDGLSIEPEWYLPIIPMVLVNGCEGIGTGYSTYIPPYNPKDIIANLLRVLDGQEPLYMKPWFKDFKGQLVEGEANGTYVTKGKWERTSDSQIKISELPVGTGVTPYKEFLESLMEGNKKDTSKTKKKFVLKDIQNKTRDENDEICFIVDFKHKEDLDSLINYNTLEKEFKLSKSFTINNMYLFGPDLDLTKYSDPNDILLDFFDLRLEYYQKRKDYIVKKLRSELKILEAKVRFITEYINGTLDINKKSKEYMINLLDKREYPKSENSYDYLTRMPIINMTLEKINELENQCKNKRSELKTIMAKSDKDLWKDDLFELSKRLF